MPKFLSDAHFVGSATDVHISGVLNISGQDIGGVTSPSLYLGHLTNAYQAGMQSSVHLTMKTTNSAGNFYWYRQSGSVMYYSDALYVNKLVDKDSTSYYLDPASTSTSLKIAGNIIAEGGTLELGKADTSSGHINAKELMTFNIDTDNDDTNRYFAWYKDSSSGSGTELLKLEESSISPDGPAKGSDLNFIYQAQATNIHTQTPMLKLHGSTGNATFAGDLTVNGTDGVKVQSGSGGNAIRLYTENDGSQIADDFSANTSKSYIYFDARSSSNDPGFIMHETSDNSTSEANKGVLHLVPSDDNSTGDYVSIHGTNDPDVLKLHTSGLVETVNLQLQLKSGLNSIYLNDDILVSGTSTFSSNVTVGSDATGKDVKFFGDLSGEYFMWDENVSTVNIYHRNDFPGLEVYVNAGAQTTQPQLKVGRSNVQYWGAYVDDRNAHLIHRQDETSGTMTTRFDQWDSNTSDLNGEWLWRSGDGTGGSMTTALTLTQAGNATFVGSTTSTKVNINQAADQQGLEIKGYDDHSSSDIKLQINSAGHARLNQTTDSASGYLFIEAENYLNLQAGTLIYTSNQFRIYDAGSLSFGSGGDFSAYYNNTNDEFRLMETTTGTKGLKMDTDGNVTLTENTVFKPFHYAATDDLNSDNKAIFSTHAVNNATSNRPINYATVYTFGGSVSNALQISTNEDYSESGMWIRQFNQNNASPQGAGWQNWTEVWTTNHAPTSKISNWDTAYNNSITTAAFSGTTTKTLTLTQQDGGTVTATFTDDSGGTATTINNNANNRVITGSGTANTLEAESGLTFDGDILELVASGTTTKRLKVSPSTDYGRAHIGRAALGKTAYDDHAGFSHEDYNSNTGYALLQNSSGQTFINANTGSTGYLRIGNVTYGYWNGNGFHSNRYYDSNDTSYYLDPASTSLLNVVHADGALTVNGNATFDGSTVTVSGDMTSKSSVVSRFTGSSNMAVGWYTIAVNSGNRAQGRFRLTDRASSRHQAVEFLAAHHYGNDNSNTITVLDNSAYGTDVFRYIRIKDGGTYEGAAIQVYIDNATNTCRVILEDQAWTDSGWQLKNFVADASDPGNVGNYSNLSEIVRVDLDDAKINGGINTTGRGHFNKSITSEDVVKGLRFVDYNDTNYYVDPASTSVVNHMDMDTGNTSGKFAVMSAAVHGSYDFYNNGTSYFNGAVTVDDNFTVTSGIANITQAATDLLTLTNTSNGGGAGVVFNDNNAGTQRIYLRGYHADGSSQGGGASLHLQSTENELVFVIGDSSNTGRIAVQSAHTTAEVDYGFYDDVNTGVYSPAAGQVGLVSDNSRKLLVSSNGVTINNGSLYIPDYIYHDGDTDTYLYFTDNNIKLRTGGDDRLQLSSSGAFFKNEVFDSDGQAIKGYRQNKATSSSWTEGNTSNQTGFYGGNFNGSEITTKWVDGPHGERIIAAETDGDSNSDYDGGYVKQITNLDINKSHLSIVYIKRLAGTTGNVYHGTGAGTNQITNLSNVSNANPYFHYPSLGSFPLDVWCVSIGVIQANNDDNTTTKLGSDDLQGVYRCDTGQKILNSSNHWKMGSAGATLNNGIRFFHYYSTDASAKLLWAKPGFYEINGDEPSLAEILTGGNRGLHTNGGDVTANKFYDSANTTYYLDPASTSTSLNAAGDVTLVSAKFNAVHSADSSGVKETFKSLHTSNNTIQIHQFGQSNSNAPKANQIGVSNAEQHLHLVTDNAATVADGSSQIGVFIKSGGNIGINTNDPDGQGYSFAEDLVIKGSASASDGVGITLRGNGKRYGVIAFGDNDDDNVGEIYYDHNADDINFRVSGNVRWSINNSTATLSHGQLILGGTGRIQGVDTVTDSTDAANKAYVDAHTYSHNHDDRYYTETESRNKFTTTDATEHDYTFTLDDESNFSGNRWYHLATLNSQNGGLHIRGAILNHVENFASQKIDIAIQVREANDGGQLEITGSLDVLHNETTGSDRAGIRVIKSAETGTYDEFKVYLRVTRYQQVTLRMTEQGTTVFNTDHSSPATTEPAPGLGGHVELDTSSTVEGNYVIDNSTIKEIYHEGHLPTYSELGTMAYSNLTGTPTIPTMPTDFVSKANGGTFSDDITIDGGTSTTLSVKCDDGGQAMIRANGDGQGTGVLEVGQSNDYGGGISYNGDNSPAFVNGESNDHITFYRLDNGTRTEVFHYGYSNSTVNFNVVPTFAGTTAPQQNFDNTGELRAINFKTLAGGNSYFYTSSGNLRGYIVATETNDEHFIIATSGGEDIAFKDGGPTGTTNLISRGDGDLWVRGAIQNGTIAYSQVTGTPTIPTNSTFVDLSNTQTITGAKTFTSTGHKHSGHYYMTAYDAAGNHYPHFNDGSSNGGVNVNWRLYTGSSVAVTHEWNTSSTIFRNALESTVSAKAPIFYDTNTAYYLNPASTSNLNSLNVAGIKISSITSNNLMGYHDTVFGAKYGTLGVDVNGKIGVAEKEITFSVEGTGWVGRHSNPVKLLDAPGADKMIVVQEINMLILYSAPLGIGSSGIARTTDNTAYAVGFYQGSGTNGNFTVTGVMPRNTMQHTTTTNARIVNRDVPVEGTKLYPNKALYWKTTRDASSSFGAYPGAQHIIKVKYRILDVSTEFTSAYASAQNINSSSITSISQAF